MVRVGDFYNDPWTYQPHRIPVTHEGYGSGVAISQKSLLVVTEASWVIFGGLVDFQLVGIFHLREFLSPYYSDSTELKHLRVA